MNIYNHMCVCIYIYRLPRWLSGKQSAWQHRRTGGAGSNPGSGRSPGEGIGYPLPNLAWIIPWTGEPGRL